ncbi:MAG: hypothetical protein HY538_03115 [Deltaproteobacteria bacterium]|nr:hypothetical protein [Deltaproteobacteria bacterium]
MKNVTITLEEEVAQWARVWAARQNLSVSRLISRFLRRRMLEETGYGAAMKQFLSRRPQVLKKGGRYPSRGELYER